MQIKINNYLHNKQVNEQITQLPMKLTNKQKATHKQYLQSNFISSNSETQCCQCLQYEEDIAILQDKLMDTHNKLIHQIDVCREQGIQIKQLQKGGEKFYEKGEKYKGGEKEKYKGEGEKEKYNKGGEGEKYNKGEEKGEKYNEKGPKLNKTIKEGEALSEVKNELLRNDLETMRNKVLSQIMKFNQLKQSTHEMQQKYKKQIQALKQKLKKCQSSRNKILHENQQLCLSLQKLTTTCSCGYEQKYHELNQAFLNQRIITNQLIEENRQIEEEKEKLFEKQLADKIRTQPQRKPRHKMRNRDDFEDTKNLIKKLELAELEIRNKNYDIYSPIKK